MLRRRHCSRSPPRLTSTIPEMQQHLNAMDTPLSDSPVDRIDASTSTAEGFPPSLAPSGQDQTAVPPSGSDDQGVSDNTTNFPVSTQTIVETPKLKATRVKAQHSRPHLLTLIACVSYLLFHLMGVDIGLRTIQGYTEPRLQHAQAQLDNTFQAMAVDYLLDMQLTNLHGTTLDRCYMKSSYEDCLVRGLHKADQVFGGLDFTSNPHIRNQTVDWVTSNCRRLLYTPQVHGLRASKLHAQVESIQHTIEDYVRQVLYKLALLRYRLQGDNLGLFAKSNMSQPTSNLNKQRRALPDVPFGFSIVCQDQMRCRLVYSRPTTLNKTSKTLKDAVADAKKEVNKWSWNLERMFRLIDYLRSPLVVLQLTLVVWYLGATIVGLNRPHSSGPKLALAEKKARVWRRICYDATHLQHDERHALGLMINTALYALLGLQLKFIILELDRLLLPVGLGVFVYHSAQAVVFVSPLPTDYPDESLHDVIRAVRELCLIDRGIEIPEPKRSTAKPKSSTPAIPASKIAARFTSPLTPIAEDLQQERKAMHTEKGNMTRAHTEVQRGHATAEDEEHDSSAERSSYVDLAVHATRTDSDDDLVIVEE